jgi:nucleoid-associated protein YgaU
MPNDAKLGLVVGVGLVIAVAVVFFRKEAPAGHPAATSVKPIPAVTPAPLPAAGRVAIAKTSARSRKVPALTAGGRFHTVQEGDTLTGLAQRYYGDGDKSAAIYRANRGVLDALDRLPPGTELLIPDLPDE